MFSIKLIIIFLKAIILGANYDNSSNKFINFGIYNKIYDINDSKNGVLQEFFSNHHELDIIGVYNSGYKNLSQVIHK